MIDLERYQGYLKPHVREILADYQEGVPVSQIAEKLASADIHLWCYPTGGIITYILKRIGAYKQPPDPQWRERWRMAGFMRGQGHTLKQIGDYFGVSKERARQMVRKSEQLKRERERRERWDKVVVNFVPRWGPFNRGRPLDMGGPRDEWIERDPWSEL